MQRWQASLLVIAAAFFGTFVYLFFSDPESSKIPSPSQSPSAIENFINKFEPKEITILLTGDIMLGRSVMGTSLEKYNDPTYPFQKVADILRSADIVFGNLENPIVKDCPYTKGGFKFCADPRMVSGLTFAGVDVVTLANNHTTNYGADGFKQTKKYLTDAGLSYVGDGNLVIKKIDDLSFGFLGFDYVYKKPVDADFQLIKDVDPKVDVLIVAVHWGDEYTSVPNEFQKLIAGQFIENGADIIYGTHPHWVQTVDQIKGRPVYYSLGNFVFDQSWSEETKKGLVVRFTFRNKELIKEDLLPIYMNNLAQPEFVK